ncbi:MAG: hypothetical protein K2X08_03860, partial [Chlamydiales bacterium]|nr:hypothetical protein [Chlamydiales bacterium]
MNIIKDINFARGIEHFDSLRLTNNFLNREEKFLRLGACKTILKIAEFVVRFFLDIISLPFRAIYATMIKPTIKTITTLAHRVRYIPLKNQEDDDFVNIGSNPTFPVVQPHQQATSSTPPLLPPQAVPPLTPPSSIYEPLDPSAPIPPLTLPQPALVTESP